MQGRTTNKSNRYNQKPLLLLEHLLLLTAPNHSKKLIKPPLFTLFLENSSEEMPHDIDKRTIPSLGRVCFDAEIYFDLLFSGA